MGSGSTILGVKLGPLIPSSFSLSMSDWGFFANGNSVLRQPRARLLDFVSPEVTL